MAFTAENGQVAGIAWLILVINVIWSVIYDTLYAMVDRDDDIAIGLKSTAILFADKDLIILRILKAAMLLLLLCLGFYLQFGWPWYAAVLLAGGLFALQQIWVKERQREACFRAFLNNNWVGLILFCGLLASYAMKV
jgi:4-hydroxybenzoate polyprenyltransferase